MIWTILSIFGAVGAALASLTTLYSFYLKNISKKIKFCSISSDHSLFDALEIIVCVENKSHSAIYVHNIVLVINNKYSMFFKRYSDPFCLSPGIAHTISSDKFTSVSNKSCMSEISFPNTFLILSTTKGNVISKFKKKWLRKGPLIPVQRLSQRLDGRILAQGMKYLLTYKQGQNEIKKIFIHEKGYLSELLFNFNQIPLEHLDSIDDITFFLKRHLSSFGFHAFQVRQLSKSSPGINFETN